jgi:predicted TIM-barrel fold metal-dependent hydrolase
MSVRASSRAWLCWAGLIALQPAGAPAAEPTADAAPPIIDVHTHVFNLRYLPVSGILVARGVPKSAADVLDRLLVGATPLADLTRPADELLSADVLDVGSMDLAQSKQWVLGRLQSALADRRELLTPKERRALRRYVAGGEVRADRPPGELTDLELVEAALDQARFDERQDRSYPRFLAQLMQNEVAIVRSARRDYPSVDLMVHHLMDMERPYDDPPAVPNDKQVGKLEPLARLFPGQLAGFVAFDPFRRERALSSISPTIEKRRALGVKFYPPSGYRAGGNVTWPDKPSWWRFALRDQWRSRYGGWQPADLNRVNEELFAYCVKRDLPLLAHCTPDGFQASAGYGAMSDPAYWRGVLEQERFRSLRLILAHAGGGASWFSTGPWDGARDFDQRAWDLATRFPNVYLDLSYSDEVLSSTSRDALRRRLEALLAPQPGRPYALGDKLVYGSDWHMVAVLDGRREILAELQRLFTSPTLAPYRARFFAGNAARALRLREWVDAAPLDPPQRQAFRALLARIDAAEAASPH